KLSAATVAALSLGSVPVALAALSRNAWGQSTPATVQAVIDFALMLEIFENEFYKAVLGTSSSSTQNTAFATVRAQVPGSALPALQQIQAHEADHVAFLTANGAVNSLSLSATSFDFTGARGAGNGPFARATTELAFLLLVAQGAEDTGVRAYKGQAGNLMSNTVVLEAALRIHSVEARHAAKIRRLRRGSGAPSVVRLSGTVSGTGSAAAGASNISNPPAAVVAALDAIYATENPTTQGSVNVTTESGLPAGVDVAAAASESFDEALTRDQVKAIVQPFFIPTIP
ncbi:MAG: ferritin-like domain-containing protein, partial [Gemmatimonadaceae bacterium]